MMIVVLPLLVMYVCECVSVRFLLVHNVSLLVCFVLLVG